jgi:glycerophosphoryl diester phosphodiesterase
MVKRIGHRGAWGYAPQNTLSSFQKALEFDLDMIELDVHRCKSGEIVVAHYPRLELTTDSFGAIKNKTLDELQELDAGDGQGIPTLQQVLDAIKKEVGVHIELKKQDTAEPVADIIDHYVQEHSWEYDDFLVSSFYPHTISAFEDRCPEVQTAANIFGLRLDYWVFKQFTDIDIVNVHGSAVTQRFVDKIKDDGFDVYTWTILERGESHFERLRSLGVDGISANCPDRLQN